MDKKYIEIKDYSKSIHASKLLNNINLTLEKGKCYGFVGTNGSGKTVLFKAICGLIRSKEGYIKIEDKIIGKDIDFPSNTGILIEYPGFLESLSGFKNLKYLAGINNKISDENIKETMKLLNLDPDDKKNVKKYSLGMKQRLGISQALMEDPELIILDEPMNALDKRGVELVREIIQNLKNQNKTILLSSHNFTDIQILCDEVFELDNGSISKFNKNEK